MNSEEVLEIINSLLDAENDAKMDTSTTASAAASSSSAGTKRPPEQHMWRIVEQRGKAARLPFNRRLLADLSNVLKEIEAEGATSFDLDCAQFNGPLGLADGMAYSFDEAAFKLPDNAVKLKLRFDQPDAEAPARLLNGDLKRIGLTGIEILATFPEGYPFCPPKVRIIRPRLRGHTGYVISGAICMQLLDAAGWSPAYTLVGVLLSIHAMLIAGLARLEIPEEGQSAEEFVATGRAEKRKRDLQHREKARAKLLARMESFRRRKEAEIKSGLNHCPGCLVPVGEEASARREHACQLCQAVFCSVACMDKATAPTGGHALVCGLDNKFKRHELQEGASAAATAAAAAAGSSSSSGLSLSPADAAKAAYDVHSVEKARAAAAAPAAAPSSPSIFSFCRSSSSSSSAAPALSAAQSIRLANLASFVALHTAVRPEADDTGAGGKVAPVTTEELHKTCLAGYTEAEANYAAAHIASLHKAEGWHGGPQRG